VDDETVLAARPLIDASALDGLRIIDVPAEEPWGADVLTLGGVIVCSTAFPRTAELLDRLGYRVRPIDVSELHKAESGVTCMSLLLN
jgi:dimethylargininase